MSAKATFENLIQEKMKAGMTRDRATAAVIKRNPDLQRELVREANEDRPAALAASQFRNE